jgi:hypothetical protein
MGILASRRYYPIWLGLVTFLFITRIFDLALFKSSDLIRIGVCLAVAILAAVLIYVSSHRVVKIVPALGGILSQRNHCRAFPGDRSS